MNIYANPGDLVMVTELSARNGREYDQEKIIQRCKIGEIYTVESVEVHSFSSYVRLVEIPGTDFNTVMFEDVRTSPRVKRSADMYSFRLAEVGRGVYQLEGQMRNHSKIPDNDTGHSGDIIRIDFEKLEAETESTIWKLHNEKAPKEVV